MRPTTILAAAAALAVVLGAATYYKLSRPVAQTEQQQLVGSDPTPSAGEQLQVKAAENVAASRLQEESTTTSGIPVLAPEVTHSNYIVQRTAELMDLAMENDDSSLQTILAELNNRDPAIRAAATEAAIQFSSRDAIPALLDAANRTEDPKEKQALVEAAEFLKLPSLTEVRAAGGFRAVTFKAKPLRKMPRPPPRAPVIAPPPEALGVPQ
jgi:hypothetical protein